MSGKLFMLYILYMYIPVFVFYEFYYGSLCRRTSLLSSCRDIDNEMMDVYDELLLYSV